jgi:nicotinate-nucleotide adenylyltransferase
MRIGVYGGTFDPIHIGHLVMASIAKEELQLDQVWMVPSYLPPHKIGEDRQPTTAFVHRLNMVSLAIQGREGFFVSDIEGKRLAPSYTIDTLTLLREQDPDVTWFFLCGADSLATIHTWHRAHDLLDGFPIGVFRRPGFDPGEIEQSLRRNRFNLERIVWIDTPELEISSTWLRMRLQQGKEVADLIPENVRSYIKEHQLYA